MKSKPRKLCDIIITKCKILWQMKTSKFLIALSSAFLIMAIITTAWLFNEGNVAENKAQELLSEYENPINSNTASESENSTNSNTVFENGNYSGYKIIGKLVIERTDQQLPIIASTSDAALKVSVCYFQGSLPGEPGNMVITGHNYASGAHFGRLNELKIGDTVKIITPNQISYIYKVYGTQIISPYDIDALQDLNYEKETTLTLLTCTNQGNQRLIVRLKLE